MLRIRIITGVVLIALAYWAFSLAPSSWAALGFCMAFVMLGGMECSALLIRAMDEEHQCEVAAPSFVFSDVLCGLSCALVLPFVGSGLHDLKIGEEFSPIYLGFCAAIFSICFYAVALYFVKESLSLKTRRFFAFPASLAYVGIPGMIMFQMAQLQLSDLSGKPIVRAGILYFGLAVIVASDTAAYFSGRAFGRHKLAPDVSPKKTIEGAIGGILAAAIMGGLMWKWLDLPRSWLLGCFTGLVVAKAGIVGDLVESALKRTAHCKDSGRILPGHGGVLDRIDALLLGLPVCYLLFSIWQML